MQIKQVTSNKAFQPTFDRITFLLPQKRAAVKRR